MSYAKIVLISCNPIGRLSPEFPPPLPIDVEDLYDSFLEVGTWSISSDRSTLKASRSSATEPNPNWQGWNRYEGGSSADIMFGSMDPHTTETSARSRCLELCSYETPLRTLPVRGCATPYPPGTMLRKAWQAPTTARRLPEQAVFDRMMACVQASSRKRLLDLGTGVKPVKPQTGRQEDISDRDQRYPSARVVEGPTQQTRTSVQDILARSAALGADLLVSRILQSLETAMDKYRTLTLNRR